MMIDLARKAGIPVWVITALQGQTDRSPAATGTEADTIKETIR